MSDENNQQSTVVVDDNQAVVAPANTEQHAEDNGITSPQQSSQVEHDDSDSDISARTQSKMSQLERERNELQKERDRLAQLAQEADDREIKASAVKLNEMFNGNPKLYEDWRQDRIAKGLKDHGSYEQLYGSSQINGSSTPTAPVQKPLTREDIAQVVLQERQFSDALNTFYDKVPDMKPENFKTDEERQKAQKEFDFIEATAKIHVLRNPDMNMGEALSKAYFDLNPDKARESTDLEKQEAELAGYAAANARNSVASGGISGSSSSNGSSSNITAEQQKVIKQLGLKGEALKLFLEDSK